MYSQRLTEQGLYHQVLGNEYNFRLATMRESLDEEYRRVLDALPQAGGRLYSAHQVHGARVTPTDTLSEVRRLSSTPYQLYTAPDTDGLITNVPGQALLIKYADCTPIIIYDPVQRAQASIHSGWRGTVQGIGLKGLAKMQQLYGTRVEDVVIYLGPSIDAAHYEVGPEVYDAFADMAGRERYFTPHKMKYLLNNQDAIYYQFLDSGLSANQIERAKVSTYKDTRLHSARQAGPDYGLNAIITIIPE